MRPYPRRILHEDSHKRHKRRVFNYHLSRARRVIENAFGILAQRWRILRRLFKAKTDNINRYGAACIVLHNFLMKESSASSAAYCPPGSADSEDWEGRLSPGSWREEEPAGGALLPSKSTGCHAARTAGLHVCCHGVRGNPWLVVICCFCSAATTVEKRLFFYMTFHIATCRCHYQWSAACQSFMPTHLTLRTCCITISDVCFRSPLKKNNILNVFCWATLSVALNGVFICATVWPVLGYNFLPFLRLFRFLIFELLCYFCAHFESTLYSIPFMYLPCTAAVAPFLWFTISVLYLYWYVPLTHALRGLWGTISKKKI